jgi:hypothetical protein
LVGVGVQQAAGEAGGDDGVADCADPGQQRLGEGVLEALLPARRAACAYSSRSKVVSTRMRECPPVTTMRRVELQARPPPICRSIDLEVMGWRLATRDAMRDRG